MDVQHTNKSGDCGLEIKLKIFLNYNLNINLLEMFVKLYPDMLVLYTIRTLEIMFDI